MYTTLRVLAALGILSCVAYVVAQGTIQGRTQDGKLYQATGQAGGGQIASKATESRYAPENGAQMALREYIMAIDNRNVELAHRDGRQDIAQSCVEVQCYYFLATMRPDERKHELNDVWEIDKYRPNGQWNHITSAPMLVDELLRIDPKVDAEINRILSDSYHTWMEPFMEQSRRVAARMGTTKKWDDMTPDEQRTLVKLNNEERDKWLHGRTAADISVEHATYVLGVVRKIKTLFTKAQLAEFDQILADFDRDMNKAYKGVPHPLGGR